MTATTDDRDWPIQRLHLTAPNTHADNDVYETTLLALADADEPAALLFTTGPDDGTPEPGLAKAKMAFLQTHGLRLAAGIAGIAYLADPGTIRALRERFAAMRGRMAEIFPIHYEVFDDEDAALAWLWTRVEAVDHGDTGPPPS